jgi:probable HAF family extracellular repeat protein
MFATRRSRLFGLILGAVSSTHVMAGETKPPIQPPPARIPTYTITDLGVLPGYEQSLALGLNNSGDVVGECWRTVFRGGLILEITAFLYRDGVMMSLGTSASYSSAAAINESGQIVGVNTFPNLTTRAFMYDQGNLFDLSMEGCSMCIEATDINDHGQIIGTHSQGVFLWDGETFTDLGSLDNRFTEAVSINNSGMVVGNSDVWVPFPPFTQPRAFLWYENEMVELPRRDESWSKAYDVNDQGTIVGYSNGAVVWESDGVELIVGEFYSTHGGPRAINNHGHIVGDGGSLSDPRAVIWRNRARYDLVVLCQPNTTWELEYARDVNDFGQIVGIGRVPAGLSMWRAYLLNPINCDADADDRVNQSDYLLFYGCQTGPNGSPSQSCATLDFDRDGDVDFIDYRSLELAFDIKVP